MGLTQMAALTGGRKFKTPYVEEINARKQYLPAIYGQKKEDAYRDKMYGLEQSRFELEQDALKAQKKAQKRANRLGYINLGVGAGLGVMNAYPARKEVGKDVVDWLNPAQTINTGAVNEIASGALSPSAGLASLPADLIGGTADIFKKFGESAFDAAKGVYDSIIGDSIDIDWEDAASAFGDIY